METLFTTNENDLEQMFDTLTEEEIQQCCPSQVYYRGVGYFENGYVTSAEFNANRTFLTAKVKGSQTYTVQVSLKNRKIEATCTCLQGCGMQTYGGYDAVCNC